MLLSTVSANTEKAMYRGVNNMEYNYTSKLNINEPSSIPAPIFKVLDNNSGEIVNDCNSLVVRVIIIV